MVMMRLRLGLFEKDLGHRFNVSIMTVSHITRSWIRFLRAEFEPLIQIPPSGFDTLYAKCVQENQPQDCAHC